MAGLLTTAGGGSHFLSVGSKNCCQSRTAQGTGLHSDFPINGFKEPLGSFLQFSDGLLSDLFISKHLIGDVEECQYHQIKCGDNRSVLLNSFRTVSDEICELFDVLSVAMSPYMIFSTEQSHPHRLGRSARAVVKTQRVFNTMPVQVTASSFSMILSSFTLAAL